MWALVEVVEEGGHAGEGGLLGAFNLDGKLHLDAADATQVGNALQRGHQTDALAAKDGLAELHLVHAIVDHHLQVVYLDNLLPQVGQERQRQVAVYDGLAEGTLSGTLLVNVYPLVVERGVGKEVDALLRHFKPVGGADNLTHMGLKFVVRVDN